MKLYPRFTLLLVSISTAVTAIGLALLYYAELMDYFSKKAFSTIEILRWCKNALGFIYVGVVVAAVGLLLARPPDDGDQAP